MARVGYPDIHTYLHTVPVQYGITIRMLDTAFRDPGSRCCTNKAHDTVVYVVLDLYIRRLGSLCNMEEVPPSRVVVVSAWI